MAEHQSKKHEIESVRRATLAAQEGLEQALQSTQPSLAPAMNGVSIADRLAPLVSPDFQAAQRSQYAVSLQKRHGNRYVQRLLAGGKGVAIVPRTNLTGIIARWPPDSDEERLRLLTLGAGNLLTLIELPLSHALASLNEESPPVLGNSWDVGRNPGYC